MNICLICYQQVEKGIRVPKWSSEQEDYIHRECLQLKLDELCQGKPEFEGKLRYLVQYEENNYKERALEYFSGTADTFWDREDVRIVPWDIKRLLDNKIISKLSAGRHPWYCLMNRQLTKEYLEKKELVISPIEGKITTDIFSVVYGYEDIKEQLVKSINRVIRGENPTHWLFEGVPATGKSIIMDCIAEALGDRMYLCTGRNTTEAGLSEALMRGYSVMGIDEIDFMESKVSAVILRFMETGDIIQTKHNRIGNGVRTNSMIIGACNSAAKLSNALKSRFYPYHLYFPPYTKEEFIEICANLLVKKEGIKDREIGRYIAIRLYDEMRHNTDPRAARNLARQLDEGTKEEIDKEIDFLKRRGKYFKEGLWK